MYTFPFTDESIIAELGNVDLAVYRQERPDTMNTPAGVIQLLDDGSVTGHPEWLRWTTLDGILYLMDGRLKYIHRIDSLETANRVVYPMGECLREAKSKFSKTILVPKVAPEFRVCISSHISYYKDTLPRLLKSLKRVGLGALVVIADGSRHPVTKDELTIIGSPDVEIRVVNYDRHGYTALLETDNSVPYWLLLHDTCELTQDFAQGLANIDVGMNPDMVLLEENSDMGFYSSEFVHQKRTMIEKSRVSKIRKQLWNQSNSWTPGPKGKSLRSKDVYGKGTERAVLLMDIGIKKYLQGQLDNKTP